MKRKKGQYRFFYHYRKQTKGMTVHFKGQCIPCKDVICEVPAETKWNKTQPNLVLRGYCKEVIIKNNKAYII